MNKIKIIFANAAINNGNLGCVALSISTMFLIGELFKKKGIEYEFYLPDSGYRHKQLGNHEISIGDLHLRYNAIWDICKSGYKAKLKNLYFHKLSAETRRVYNDANYIIDIGQGDSFSDIYGVSRFMWMFSDYKQGAKYHIPYCVLPQTIGPFESPFVKEKAKQGLGWAKTIMVRDKQSLDCVKLLLPERNDIHEIIDVAFFMPYIKHGFVSDYVHVGLNISSLLWHGGYTQNNQFSLKVDYQKTIREILDFFLSKDNVIVHLIPHVVGYDNGVENDYAVSYQLFHEYAHPQLLLSPLFRNPIDAKGYIAGMDFFIGARMHSTIAAFSSGVPVVPMAYSRKFNGLFKDTLQYDAMVDMKTQDDAEILSIIKDAFNKKSELKEIIENRMNGVVAERRRLLMDDLTKFFNL